MKLKDKNAALRTPENRLPLKAKARLCVQGQHDPDAKLGTVKTDAPTVQRSGFHAFLQLAANLGWLAQLAIGDISSAFLQGEPRRGPEPLYMRQPRGGLPGLEPGQLLKIEKGIYGLPDAPPCLVQHFPEGDDGRNGVEAAPAGCGFFLLLQR